jgi:tyrosyl-tRNA synthetase
MSNNAYDVLEARGFVRQVTDEGAIRKLFNEGPVVAYVGYDPTADSLHVGHLFTIMALMHLERAGHRPIAVLGGGTARVGDPSGKSEMRMMLDGDTISSNIERFKNQMARLLNISNDKSMVVDNSEWLLELNYIDFLRDIGRHFSVNRMLSMEAYKLRMERGLSFIEFNYQLLQAYDFLELYRRYNCKLQMGGDDQWGNILAGIDLCRRVEQTEVYGLTFPLQLTATGEKMGKTATGAVWLEPDRLSPYDFYQYWVNIHDDDVVRMLGYFTFLPMDEVNAVAALVDAALNSAKSILAYEVTKLIHGKDEAVKAHSAAQGAFGGRELEGSILSSSDVPRKVQADSAQVPSSNLGDLDLGNSPPLADVLAAVGLCGSKNEARRLLKQGAVKLDEQKVADEKQLLQTDEIAGDSVLLRVGKKKVHRLVF